MRKTLSISIVTYKTSKVHLEKCLKSLFLTKIDFHIYIIDNSPTNELHCMLAQYGDISYQHLPSNPGFGAGHNVAIRQAQRLNYDYHLIINADVYFNCDVLRPMIEFMDDHLKVGLMMPKVLNTDGTIQRLCKRVPSPFDLVVRRVLPNCIKNLMNYKFELHSCGYDKITFVPYLSGCFMLLRHNTLTEVGIFDERFFMYPEDIDLSRRIAEKYDTLFFPNVHIYHHHGAASHFSLKMLLIHAFNLVKYFNKWGWFIDPIRVQLNDKTLQNIKDNVYYS